MAKQEVAVDCVGVDVEELKRRRKAAKKAVKDAAAMLAEAEASLTAMEVDEEQEKRQRKAAKKAAKEAAAAAASAQVGEEEEKRQRKAAKKAAKDAAAAESERISEVASAAVGEDDAKRLRKAAKRAVTEAEDAQGERMLKELERCMEAPALELDEAEAKRQRKAAKKVAKEAAGAGTKRAAEEAEIDEEQAAKAKQSKTEQAALFRGKTKAKKEEGEEGHIAFIRNLSWSVSQQMLQRDFTECGEIERIKMPMNEEGKPRGFAFVRFLTQDGFDAAVKFDNTEYAGRTIYVCKAGENTQGTGKDRKGKGIGKGPKDDRNNPLTICIKGLPFVFDDSTLRKDFTECGEIAKMNMPRNEEGLTRGMAFVTYKTQEGFDAAFKLDGTDYAGRYLSITKPLLPGEAVKGKDGKDNKGEGKGKDGKDGKDGKGKGKGKGKDKDGKNKGKDS